MCSSDLFTFSSYPFGEVEKVKWEDEHTKLGYGAKGHLVFEPPEEHKGNVARALLYVASVYDLQMIEGEPETLLAWHQADPVDEQERQRNAEISRFQRNRNPFIDHPDLADRVFSQIEVQPAPDFMRPKASR